LLGSLITYSSSFIDPLPLSLSLLKSFLRFKSVSLSYRSRVFKWIKLYFVLLNITAAA
jgi:hypothetical protein